MSNVWGVTLGTVLVATVALAALPGTESVLAGASTSDNITVYVTAVRCAGIPGALVAQTRRSGRTAGIFLDGSRALPPLPEADENGRFNVTLSATPGFHRVTVVDRDGTFATEFFDALPGHARDVNVDLCDIFEHHDSLRSLSVALPLRGLIAYVVTTGPTGRLNITHMQIDRGAAYVIGLDAGPIRLFVSYGAQSDPTTTCTYNIDPVRPNPVAPSSQHLRYELTSSSLRTSFGVAYPRCGSVTEISAEWHDSHY